MKKFLRFGTITAIASLPIAITVSCGSHPIKPGEERDGAKCKDGSSTDATGRGACSNHGGVDYWTASN